uniref:Uncharacterized protein n=1 Tax=Varanus komodoensis TaxID=61221 RepID=A0A8D2LA94_VARKO
MRSNGLKSRSKGHFPCEIQEGTERSWPPANSAKKESTKSDKLKCRPHTRKVSYCDVPSNVVSEKIAKDLKELGRES